MKATAAIATALLTFGTTSAQNAFVEAPEVTVYYLNVNVSSDACTDYELQYVDNKITPDLDMILLDNDIAATEWTLTVDNAANRKLRGGEDRELNATCDWCRTMYPRHLCNSIYNCGFRRQLQEGSTLTEAEKTALAAELKAACEENLAIAAARNVLDGVCNAGIVGAECFVEFN